MYFNHQYSKNNEAEKNAAAHNKICKTLNDIASGVGSVMALTNN